MESTIRDMKEISKLREQTTRVNFIHQNKESILFTLMFVNECCFILMLIYINN